MQLRKVAVSAQPLSAWRQTHALQVTLRWLGILFICALAGVVTGAIAYAPLHRPVPVAVGVSVLAALLYGALWLQQQRAAVHDPILTARR